MVHLGGPQDFVVGLTDGHRPGGWSQRQGLSLQELLVADEPKRLVLDEGAAQCEARLVLEKRRARLAVDRRTATSPAPAAEKAQDVTVGGGREVAPAGKEV